MGLCLYETVSALVSPNWEFKAAPFELIAQWHPEVSDFHVHLNSTNYQLPASLSTSLERR